MVTLLNEDCMDVMARYPDKYFDLAIVDPPYGIGIGKVKRYQHNAKTTYISKDWDAYVPDKTYFDELRRVSKNQIVWGGNYFSENLISSRGWIFWDKNQTIGNYADGELAWTSIDCNLKKVSLTHAGFLNSDRNNNGGERIHPTQNPVKLYQWIFDNYAQKDFKIIDTHLGSGSNAIAAHYFGIAEFIGCEIDEDYYHAAAKRFNQVTSQIQIFQ